MISYFRKTKPYQGQQGKKREKKKKANVIILRDPIW